MPCHRYSACPCTPTPLALAGYALFAGGQFGASLCDVVDVYDAVQDIFFPARPLTTPRMSVMGAGNGDVAMFAGGSDGAGLSKVIDVYTVASVEEDKAKFLRGENKIRQC